MIKGLILIFVLFITLMAIGWYISNNIATELSSQEGLEQETIDAINNINEEYNNVINGFIIVCIFSAPALLALYLLGKYTDSDPSYSDVTGDDIFPIANERKMEDAVTILKRRYANGEINSFEYTERMARL